MGAMLVRIILFTRVSSFSSTGHPARTTIYVAYGGGWCAAPIQHEPEGSGVQVWPRFTQTARLQQMPQHEAHTLRLVSVKERARCSVPLVGAMRHALRQMRRRFVSVVFFPLPKLELILDSVKIIRGACIRQAAVGTQRSNRQLQYFKPMTWTTREDHTVWLYDDDDDDDRGDDNMPLANNADYGTNYGATRGARCANRSLSLSPSSSLTHRRSSDCSIG
uniref:Putative secreted protein n=1 Tax=Anopheles marajoara TaxID=58244 RepID=A0A2M4C5V7_9DIPT